MKTSKKSILAAIGLVATLTILFLAPVVVYTDKIYVCDNSGSWMGYRQWIFGPRTGEWHEKSNVEAFIQYHYPGQFTNRWAYYSGVGQGIFRKNLAFGGRLVRFHLVRVEALNRWFDPLPDSEKKAFYDLLVADDRETIRERVNDILNFRSETTEKVRK